VLSPLFDLICDARYGRVEECFEEDPYLVGQLGSVFVRSMQHDPTQTSIGFAFNKMMYTGKHFAIYNKPIAGINLAPAEIGERELHSMFLAPFVMFCRMQTSHPDSQDVCRGIGSLIIYALLQFSNYTARRQLFNKCQTAG
jgi:beta-glucosidase-like glycosyl hydrolase